MEQRDAHSSTGCDFINLDELEGLARARLPKMVFDYYAGGAGSEASVRYNAQAFSQYKLLPRMLVDVSKIDMSCELLGVKMSCPILVAPMAMHGMADPVGKELATARAAAQEHIPMVVSTMATSSIAEVAAAVDPAGLMFQLYVIKDRAVVETWVRQAEQLGYRALMVTVDAQRLGRREADERNRFRLPDGLELKNLLPLQQKARQAGQETQELMQARATEHGSGLFELFAKEVDDSLTWNFIPWLRTITKMPIILKGLLSPDDAALALQYGADGIVLSNHGGRQLDSAPSALEMLPAVASVVQGQVPLLIDGGVRRGTDVLKALALGADAVLLGRPVLYALAVGGQAGVQRALKLLQDDLELAMALAGCRSLADVTPRLLLCTSAPAQQVCSEGTSGTSACAVAAESRACCSGPVAVERRCGSSEPAAGCKCSCRNGWCCGGQGSADGSSYCKSSSNAACGCHALQHSVRRCSSQQTACDCRATSGEPRCKL